jgi:hypothetical protein
MKFAVNTVRHRPRVNAVKSRLIAVHSNARPEQVRCQWTLVDIYPHNIIGWRYNNPCWRPIRALLSCDIRKITVNRTLGHLLTFVLT